MPDPACPSYADDLSWIVGVAHWVELEGGFWELEYGGADAPLGGRVVIGRPAALHGGTSDVRVRVRGRAEPLGASVFMTAPAYLIDELELLDGQ